MRRETKNCKGTTDTSTGRGGRADPAEGSTKKKKKKTNVITQHRKKNMQSQHRENEKNSLELLHKR